MYEFKVQEYTRGKGGLVFEPSCLDQFVVGLELLFLQYFADHERYAKALLKVYVVNLIYESKLFGAAALSWAGLRYLRSIA